MKSLATAGVLATNITASKPDKGNVAMRGTNIGGWQVLEPWITPSMFYRFLGKTHTEGVGMDQYTFCEALGPEVGNAVLREHWDTWITEETFKETDHHHHRRHSMTMAEGRIFKETDHHHHCRHCRHSMTMEEGRIFKETDHHHHC